MSNQLLSNSKSESDFNSWVDERFIDAKKAIQASGIKTYMELTARPINVSKPSKLNSAQLKEIVQTSQIHTFGWPIGVMLNNRDEYKTIVKNFGRDNTSGIETNIAFSEDKDKRFDYWALVNNGYFYLSKSLFEDTRKKEVIFVDTRIIRTTECLMFLKNLYSEMGNKNDEIEINLKYYGIKNRRLAVASPSRLWFSERINRGEETTGKVTINTSIKKIDENIVGLVNSLTKELFDLFDSYIVDGKVLSNIVTNYLSGKVT